MGVSERLSAIGGQQLSLLGFAVYFFQKRVYCGVEVSGWQEEPEVYRSTQPTSPLITQQEMHTGSE